MEIIYISFYRELNNNDDKYRFIAVLRRIEKEDPNKEINRETEKGTPIEQINDASTALKYTELLLMVYPNLEIYIFKGPIK